MKQEDLHCDLMVIGSGIAGMAAALFAAKRNISTVQAGASGEINYASGLIDLLAFHKAGAKKRWSDPKEAMDALIKANPEHPYGRVGWEEIVGALNEFFGFMERAGMPYHHKDQKNYQIPTAAGTIKTTYGVPSTMVNGAIAFEKKERCLIVSINGLKGFSARQMAENLKSSWPGLSHGRIDFPGATGELYAEQMARTLEIMKNRVLLADALKPLVKDHACVGLPAVLGIYGLREIQKDLENMLGVRLFEIPIMPPSVTGIRMRERFENALPRQGVRCLYQKRVLSFEKQKSGLFHFEIGADAPEVTVSAKAAILATGRFFGKGLASDRKNIRETIFDLPVFQPETREEWHDKAFLKPEGHAVNRAGIETDTYLRPVGKSGAPVHDNLFAAGSLLAHNDWTRLKCGSGVAIATACKAVESYQLLFGKGP